MANVHVSLRLDEKLVAEIDADAERLERSRNWVISRRLENSRTLPPLYKLDRETGDISAMDEGPLGRSLGRTPSKKIADVSVRFGAQEDKWVAEMAKAEDGSLIGVGGTPRLPRLGKTEIGGELSPVARTPELMAGLRKIAAGDIHANHFAHDPDAEQAEVDLCGERFHSEVDGEWYMCGKEKHPFPKVKHGDWIKV